MHERRCRVAAARASCAACMAAVDFALWDIKGKLLKAPVSALLGGRRARVATYANCAHHLPPDKLAEKAAGYVKRGPYRAEDPRLGDVRVAATRRPSA